VCGSLLQLVVVESAGDVLLAQDVRDRLTVAIGGAEAPVARSVMSHLYFPSIGIDTRVHFTQAT